MNLPSSSEAALAGLSMEKIDEAFAIFLCPRQEHLRELVIYSGHPHLASRPARIEHPACSHFAPERQGWAERTIT